MDEPKTWINDGHQIDLMLDGDQVFPRVICPYDGVDPGKGAACRNEGKGPCGVREAVAETRFEGNCTGLTILCRDQVPIEYNWTGPEVDEFYFKVSGYPTSSEVIRQRKELALVLIGDEKQHRQIPEQIVEQMSFQSWFDLDDETKDNIREDWNRHQEGAERRSPAAAKRAEQALPPKEKPKHEVAPQPKVDVDEPDEEEPEEEEEPIDPLLKQAEALPSFVKGSEGKRDHAPPAVAGMEGGGEMAEDAMDPKPGSSPDPSTFTADS